MFEPFNLEQMTLSTCFEIIDTMRTRGGSQSHGSRMRSEADLCDSNLVHGGAANEWQGPRVRLSIRDEQPLWFCRSNHTSHVRERDYGKKGTAFQVKIRMEA